MAEVEMVERVVEEKRVEMEVPAQVMLVENLSLDKKETVEVLKEMVVETEEMGVGMVA